MERLYIWRTNPVCRFVLDWEYPHWLEEPELSCYNHQELLFTPPGVTQRRKPIITGLCSWDVCNMNSFTMWFLLSFFFFFGLCDLTQAVIAVSFICIYYYSLYLFYHVYYFQISPVSFLRINMCSVMFIHCFCLHSVWPSFEKIHYSPMKWLVGRGALPPTPNDTSGTCQGKKNSVWTFHLSSSLMLQAHTFSVTSLLPLCSVVLFFFCSRLWVILLYSFFDRDKVGIGTF